MASIEIFFLLASTLVVSGQRPSYAGSRPIGFPVLLNKTTTTPSTLQDKFGEGTTQRLPIEAQGDRELIDTLSKLPVDKQPFWFINWQALEAQREKPQTYPQKPNQFLEANVQNSNTAQNQNPGFANPNPGFVNPNPGFANPNPGFANPKPGLVNPSPGFQNRSPSFVNSNTGTTNSNTATGIVSAVPVNTGNSNLGTPAQPSTGNVQSSPKTGGQAALDNKNADSSVVNRYGTETSTVGSTSTKIDSSIPNTASGNNNFKPGENIQGPTVAQEEDEFEDFEVKTFIISKFGISK